MMFNNPSEVTKQFQRISQEIIQTKEVLEKEYPDTGLHSMIGKIQVHLTIIIAQLSSAVSGSGGEEAEYSSGPSAGQSAGS